MQPNNIQSRDVFFNHQETRLLRSNYFDPKILTRRSPGGLLRGGMMTNGVTAGPKWVDDTVHFFFQDRFFIYFENFFENICLIEHSIFTFMSLKSVLLILRICF